MKLLATGLKGSFPLKNYRQLDRFENNRQSAKYYISLTLYGNIYKLREV